MRKALIAFLTFVSMSSLLWAPPQNNPSVVAVSAPPSGGCTASEIRMVRSTGDSYACLGSVWTLLKIKANELTADTPADGECLVYDSSTDGFEWVSCASGGGGSGTSTIQEGDSTVVSAASVLDFGVGFDLTESPSGEANVTLDYTEKPIVLTTGSGEVTGTLPVINGGTGSTLASGARSNLGAAASGVNADITGFTGILTPISAGQGGTGLGAAQDDNVMVGNGTTWQSKALTNCPSGNQLLYDSSTNAFSCEADGAVGGSGVEASEEGVDVTAATRNRINLIGGAITAADDVPNTRINITLSQSPSASTSVVGTGRTLTGGAGLAAIGDLSADRTLSIASTESGFLTDGGAGPLNCAAAPGAMQVLDSGPVEYCDGNTTTTRRTAFGDTSGNALTGDSATAFFGTGVLEPAIGGTGTNNLGTNGEVLFNVSGNVGNATSGTFSYDDSTGSGTLTVGTLNTFGAADGSRGMTLQDNTTEPSAPSSNTFLYALGGEVYKKDSGDSTTERLLLNPGNITGDVTFSQTGASAIGADAIRETMLRAVNAATDEYCLTYETTTGDFEWQSCGSGGGAPTNAQYLLLSADTTITSDRTFTPGTGLAGVDGGDNAAYTLSLSYANTLASNSLTVDQATFGGNGTSVGLLFEGDTADGNETLLIPADPAADATLTLPNSTGIIMQSSGGDYGNFTCTGATCTIDGTSVTPDMILAAGQTDELCLTYEGTGDTWEWQSCGSGAGDITDVFSCSTGDCTDITTADGDQLDFSTVNNSDTNEGLKLPQATSVVGGTAEGQIAWDSDNHDLHVGNGSSGTVLINAQATWPYYVSGRYYDWRSNASKTQDAASSRSLTSDVLTAVPFIVYSRRAFDRFYFYIETAGTTACDMRVGIYTTGSDGLPSTLVADLGKPSSDCLTNLQRAVTITQTLDAGRYWLAMVAKETGGPTLAISAVSADGSNGVSSLLGWAEAGDMRNLDAENVVTATFDCGAGCNTTLPASFGTATLAGGATPIMMLRAQ